MPESPFPDAPNAAPIKGRGASWNPQNRFEKLEYVVDEDAHVESDSPLPKTVYLRDPTRTIIATNDSPDISFDASMNPYRGCEHGCIYCFARPTHEFLGMSAGLDFETKILVKEDAPELLREELASPRWVPKVLAISGVTDCYQPIEKKLQITRRCLEVLADFRNPAAMITKNHLVTRDIDHLAELAKYGCARVFISVTTLDANLARIMEPRTSMPEMRLDAIAKLSAAGIPVGVMVAPIIPAITDHEVPAILKATREAGAEWAGSVVLRLPWAVAPIFERWLEEHFPDRKEKVLNRVRDMRGGKMYDSRWGVRQRGMGEFADQIDALFDIARRKAGFEKKDIEMTTEHFRRRGRQGSLF